MEQYGSTATYNMESVLRKNVMDSEYFRDTCLKLSSWQEVVDEIFYTVKDVEPWMSGNARGASSAFCLLYRSVRIQPKRKGFKPKSCVAARFDADNSLAFDGVRGAVPSGIFDLRIDLRIKCPACTRQLFSEKLWSSECLHARACAVPGSATRD